MLRESTILIERPTDSRQILHLLDMEHFFGNDLHIKPLDEAVMLNYEYGIINTKNFDEFCDTMHTALYWMNDRYAHLCQIDKTSEALNLSTDIDKGKDIDEEAYRYDILFGAWMAFVAYDSRQLRADFLNELSGMDENQFIHELYNRAKYLKIVETFTIKWIKKMVDPHRAAGYGHYMLYFMAKVVLIMKERDEETTVMYHVMTDLYIFTQSASRLSMMNEHQLPMN